MDFAASLSMDSSMTEARLLPCLEVFYLASTMVSGTLNVTFKHGCRHQNCFQVFTFEASSFEAWSSMHYCWEGKHALLAVGKVAHPIGAREHTVVVVIAFGFRPRFLFVFLSVPLGYIANTFFVEHTYFVYSKQAIVHSLLIVSTTLRRPEGGEGEVAPGTTTYVLLTSMFVVPCFFLLVVPHGESHAFLVVPPNYAMY